MERTAKGRVHTKAQKRKQRDLRPFQEFGYLLVCPQHGSEVQEQSPVLIAVQTAALSSSLLVPPRVSDPLGSDLLLLIPASRRLAPTTWDGCFPDLDFLLGVIYSVICHYERHSPSSHHAPWCPKGQPSPAFPTGTRHIQGSASCLKELE